MITRDDIATYIASQDELEYRRMQRWVILFCVVFLGVLPLTIIANAWAIHLAMRLFQ
jgi:hypothetical protein